MRFGWGEGERTGCALGGPKTGVRACIRAPGEERAEGRGMGAKIEIEGFALGAAGPGRASGRVLGVARAARRRVPREGSAGSELAHDAKMRVSPIIPQKRLVLRF